MAHFLPPAFDLLIVEDNPGDVLLLVEALQDLCTACQIHVVTDGLEALRFLRREWGFEAAPTPSLVLLDLQVPTLSGFDLLASIKPDPRLRPIPVVVFSASADEQDVRRAYDLHANCFLTKPTGYDAYLAAIRSLERFWCHTAMLPTAAMTAHEGTD